MTPENQLNLRSRHPDFQTFLDINENESKRVRAQYPCTLNIPYGNAPLQTLDIFPSATPNAPVLIFIHGGYWKALDKKSYSFIAEPYINNNITTCIINYQLIPNVTMKGLVNDVRSAINWILKEISHYNGNSNKIILSGHSAGGHLALLSYLSDQQIRNSTQAICSLSGIFDLAPIKNSYLNNILNLNDLDVTTFSVSNKDLSIVTCPTLISVGANETAFFIEQSKTLCTQNNSIPHIAYYEYEKLNHYEIVHKLGQTENPISKFIFDNI